MSEPPPPDDGDSIAVEIIPITSGSGGEFAEAIQALIAGFQKAHVPTTLLDSLREVEKLPTLHTDPHEQDFMRRYFTQWDRFYKFREHARMKGQNRQVVSRRANTIRRLRDIVANHEKMASDDDEDDGEVDDNVDGAPAEAPAAVVEWRPTAPKHFRPKGTPAPAQPLQETDFAKQSYHVAMSEMAFSIYHVAGFASDKPYQLGWPSNLVDIVLDVSAYFGRRLTTLLRPNKVLTKELCNQAFDDSVEFLLRMRDRPLQKYSKNERKGWWKRHREAIGKPVKEHPHRRTTLNCSFSQYDRPYRTDPGTWCHRTEASGGCPPTISVGLACLPSDDPPPFDEVLPLGPEPDFLAGRADDEIVNGFTAERHRRARRWVHYEATTFYNLVFGAGWQEFSAAALAEKMVPRVQEAREAREEARRLRRLTRTIRPHLPRSPFTTRRSGSAGKWAVTLDTRFTFGNEYDSIEGHRLPSGQYIHQVLLGISNIPDREVADALCRFASDIYFECLDLFTAIDMVAWVANIFVNFSKSEFALDMSDLDANRGHVCSDISVHVPLCCSSPTPCSQLVGGAICSVCDKLVNTMLGPVDDAHAKDFPKHIVRHARELWKADYVLKLLSAQPSPDFRVPSAKSVLDSLPKIIPPSNENENILIRPDIVKLNPLVTRLVDEKLVDEKLVDEKLVDEKLVDEKLVDEKLVDKKLVTSMFCAENIGVTSHGEARLTFAYGSDATSLVLKNMIAYQKARRAGAGNVDSWSALHDDDKGHVPFFESSHHGPLFNKIDILTAEVKKVPWHRRKRILVPARDVKKLEDKLASKIAQPVASHIAVERPKARIESRTFTDDAERKRLTGIVEEIEKVHGRGRLPRGSDGLPSPFTGEGATAPDWTLKKMRALCTMLVRRTILMCNRGQPIDSSTGYDSHYLNMCRGIILNDGVCKLTGLPFVRTSRHHARVSMGHIRHHHPMNSGWTERFPSALSQFIPEKCNIQPESWAANYYKSDYEDDDIDAHIQYLLTPDRMGYYADKAKRDNLDIDEVQLQKVLEAHWNKRKGLQAQAPQQAQAPAFQGAVANSIGDSTRDADGAKEVAQRGPDLDLDELQLNQVLGAHWDKWKASASASAS